MAVKYLSAETERMKDLILCGARSLIGAESISPNRPEIKRQFMRDAPCTINWAALDPLLCLSAVAARFTDSRNRYNSGRRLTHPATSLTLEFGGWSYETLVRPPPPPKRRNHPLSSADTEKNVVEKSEDQPSSAPVTSPAVQDAEEVAHVHPEIVHPQINEACRREVNVEI